MTKAFITGVTGQDGSYLAELLLSKGYTVAGLVRRTSTSNMVNLSSIKDNPRLYLFTGDLSDGTSLNNALEDFEPDEIYNLGAMSFVPTSWGSPEYTYEVNTVAVLKLLESMKNYVPNARFYQASTSEMFGKVREMPQRESTPFYPRSPYGVSKVSAYWTVVNQRESFDLHACNGILFNHESPRRGIEFVTRKISNGVARINHGLQDKLYLGNLDAKRDWGHAKDYVRAMWMILQHETPTDFVIGSGVTRSVREFCEIAFEYIGLDYADYVEVSEEFYRPAEVDVLLSDPSKAVKELGWEPKISFKELVEEMVQNDIEEVGRELRSLENEK